MGEQSQCPANDLGLTVTKHVQEACMCQYELDVADEGMAEWEVMSVAGYEGGLGASP